MKQDKLTVFLSGLGFKKQGKVYTRLLVGMILAAGLCYLLGSLFSVINEASLQTVAATEYEIGEGCETQGYVVREELVLTSPLGITTPILYEGEKVSVKQVVAQSFEDEAAQAREAELADLRGRLEQLESALAASDSATEQAALDKQIQNALILCAKALSRQDLDTVAASVPALKGLVLKRSVSPSDLANIESEAVALRQEITDLQNKSAGCAITASASGYYSGNVDGFESVLTPKSLSQLSASAYAVLKPDAVSDDAFGKLIVSDTWYYVTTAPAAELSGLSVGSSVSVSFPTVLSGSLSMRITRLTEDDDGMSILVLSCDRYVRDITLLRMQRADMKLRSYSGLKIPKSAVRVDESGVTGVYVLESAKAKWKPITIVHDTGESYVVSLDKSSTGHLWPFDEILINARNLYDGKVIG